MLTRCLHLIILIVALFVSLTSHTLGFFDDKDLIWKSGFDSFLLKGFDVEKHGANDHPVGLDIKELSNVFSSLQVRKDGFFTKDEEAVLLFDASSSRRLAEYISSGLERARPDQDIFFTIQTRKKTLLVITKKSVTSGRVFYRGGRLNIIIGDYKKPINDTVEDMLDPGDTGNSATIFSLNDARRDGRGHGFNVNIVKVRGIENKTVNDKPRKNWLVINVPLASEAYLAKKREMEELLKDSSEKRLEREAALLARQRREMRVDMARMRKEIDALNNEEGRAAPKSIEERMMTLDGLLAKKLITREEYDARRQAILNEI